MIQRPDGFAFVPLRAEFRSTARVGAIFPQSDWAFPRRRDPQFECDGKETYVMCNGVKLAIRRDDRWVSIEPGVTVRDIVENGRVGIEVEYRRVTVH
jgi:hypothetical protein